METECHRDWVPWWSRQPAPVPHPAAQVVYSWYFFLYEGAKERNDGQKKNPPENKRVLKIHKEVRADNRYRSRSSITTRTTGGWPKYRPIQPMVKSKKTTNHTLIKVSGNGNPAKEAAISTINKRPNHISQPRKKNLRIMLFFLSF